MIITHAWNYFLKNKYSIASFLLVGLSSAIVYFSVFTFLWKVCSLTYTLAVSVSYLLSILFHFIANRYITFKSYGQNILQHIRRYLVMVGINYLVTIAIVYVVVEKLHLSPYYGIILGIAATVNTGYFLARYWVFQIT